MLKRTVGNGPRHKDAVFKSVIGAIKDAKVKAVAKHATMSDANMLQKPARSLIGILVSHHDKYKPGAKEKGKGQARC